LIQIRESPKPFRINRNLAKRGETIVWRGQSFGAYEMSMELVLLKMMRFILRSVALVMGSGSIVLVWASFYDGSGGSYAFVALAIATGITLGLEEPPAARPRPRR
jgi:hypothetical protein